MTAALEGGEWSAARPGRTLPPGKTRYPFYRRLGGPQGRYGGAENFVPTGIRSRIVQPLAQSLYRLSYRAHNNNNNNRRGLRPTAFTEQIVTGPVLPLRVSIFPRLCHSNIAPQYISFTCHRRHIILQTDSVLNSPPHCVRTEKSLGMQMAELWNI